MFYKFEWVCAALLEFKSRPGLDEGIFESYVHLNIVVPDLAQFIILLSLSESPILPNTNWEFFQMNEFVYSLVFLMYRKVSAAERWKFVKKL